MTNHATTTPAAPLTDAQKLAAFHELDHAINELKWMAYLCNEAVEDLFAGRIRRDVGEYSAIPIYGITSDQKNAAGFSIAHLQVMIRALEEEHLRISRDEAAAS